MILLNEALQLTRAGYGRLLMRSHWSAITRAASAGQLGRDDVENLVPLAKAAAVIGSNPELRQRASEALAAIHDMPERPALATAERASLFAGKPPVVPR